MKYLVMALALVLASCATHNITKSYVCESVDTDAYGKPYCVSDKGDLLIPGQMAQ